MEKEIFRISNVKEIQDKVPHSILLRYFLANPETDYPYQL
jgi:hypothetical protein